MYLIPVTSFQSPDVSIYQQLRDSVISKDNSFIADRRLRGLSPRTCQFYEGYLTRFVNTIYKPLLDISKNDIATVLGSLACNADGKHAYFRVLRAFYRWTCQEGLLVNSPMVNMKAPKVPAPLRYSVDLDAIPVLLAACQNLRDKLVVSLLADTGLRLSELASLKVVDIELEETANPQSPHTGNSPGASGAH